LNKKYNQSTHDSPLHVAQAVLPAPT